MIRPWCAVLLVPVAVAIGCSGPSTPRSTVAAGEAYAAVVRWAVVISPEASASATAKPIVFVASSSGEPIDAGDQAAVAAATRDVAVVRFADLRNDALDLTLVDRPVKDAGLLLLLGPVATGGATADIAVEVYRSVVDDRSFSVSVAPAGGPDLTVTSSTLTSHG
jgi:hypothetical protein